MQVRDYTEKDYPMLCNWWEQWGWLPAPVSCLPATGLIVSNFEQDIYAAFIYRTDSSICIIEYFISNKQANKAVRKGGLDFLIASAKKRALAMGFQFTMCWIKNPALIAALVRADIMPHDKETTSLFGVL